MEVGAQWIKSNFGGYWNWKNERVPEDGEKYTTMATFFNTILYGNLGKLTDTSLLYKGSDNIISLYF